MPEIHFVWTYAPSQRFRSSVLRPAPARREQAVEDLVDARGVPDAVHVVTGLGVAQNTLLDVVVGHREGLMPRPVRRTKHLLPDAANQYNPGSQEERTIIERKTIPAWSYTSLSHGMNSRFAMSNFQLLEKVVTDGSMG